MDDNIDEIKAHLKKQELSLILITLFLSKGLFLKILTSFVYGYYD
jgi:hypothetical protein